MSFLYSLRLTRWGIAGFSALAFALTLLQSIGFYQIVGHTPAERAAFGRSMAQLAAQFTVLIAAPIRPDTVGGYVQWRAYSFFAILFAIWALVSAYGAARGDEERGLVEQVLATGTARTDALVTRVLGFAAGCVVAVTVAALGVEAGVSGAHESIGIDSLAGVSVNLLGLALCCYALTMLVCQFAASRYATAASAIVLLGLFLLNSLSRQLDQLSAWRWLSPFRYYDLSQPLAPGGTFDVRGVEALFGSAAVMGGALVVIGLWILWCHTALRKRWVTWLVFLPMLASTYWTNTRGVWLQAAVEPARRSVGARALAHRRATVRSIADGRHRESHPRVGSGPEPIE